MESTLRELTKEVIMQKYDIPDSLYLVMTPVNETGKYK